LGPSLRRKAPSDLQTNQLLRGTALARYSEQLTLLLSSLFLAMSNEFHSEGEVLPASTRLQEQQPGYLFKILMTEYTLEGITQTDRCCAGDRVREVRLQ